MCFEALKEEQDKYFEELRKLGEETEKLAGCNSK